MTRFLRLFFFTGIMVILGNTAIAQGSAGWQILLNNDRSPFSIHVYNNEMTFYFSPKKDTLTFSLNNSKPIKDNFVVEVTLRNSKKSIYTSTEKNLASSKLQIIIPMADVYKAATGQKLPSKPKYTIAIKDKTTVKEKLNFEFKE
jgi:hypothetical protein